MPLPLILLVQILAILVAVTDAVGPAATSNGASVPSEDHPRYDDREDGGGVGRGACFTIKFVRLRESK